jgi:hypothetical protein
MPGPILPDDPIEFEKTLSNRLKRIDKTIKESRKRKRRDLTKRLEVIEQFREQYSERRSQVHDLGLKKEIAEIDEVLKELEREHKALSNKLERVAKDEPDEPPAPKPPEPKPAPKTQAAPPPEPPPPPKPPKPLPRLADPLLKPVQLKLEVELLVSRADKLLLGADNLETPELRRRVQLLAYEGRLAQGAHPSLRDNESELGKEIRRFFGRMSKICKDVLNPQGQFVKGLRPEDDENWASLWRQSAEELDELLQIQREEAEQRRKREEAERIKAQRDQADRQHALEMLAELRHLIEQKDANPDEHPDWQDEMLGLAREVVTHAPEIPEELPDLVAPWAELFVGPVFRRFRRELQRRGLIESTASGRHAAVPELPESPEEEEVHINRAGESMQYWRGRGKGQTAVVVGGTKRDHAVRRIREFFGFDDVEWVANERSERAPADSLAERIRNGNVGVLFYLARFSGHSLQDKLKPACHEAGVPFACVEHGYGLPQLCKALDATGQYAEEALG